MFQRLRPRLPGLDALRAQIEMVTNEIVRTQAQILAALQFKEIQREVSRIAGEVEVLQPQIASLYAAYLAQLERPQDQVFVQQPSNEIVQASVLEDGTITLESEAATLQQEDNEQFTAEAAVTAQNFFGSNTGRTVLALGVGIVLFLALGGGRSILSLVRRLRTVI